MLRVSLIGNLGADPELRYTAKGSSFVVCRVAVNSVRTGPDGERQENTDWFRVRVGTRQQEFAQRLSKGNRVLVIGRLDIGRYQARDGETRTSFDVWADEIQSMGPRAASPEPEALLEADSDAPAGASLGVSSVAEAAPPVRAAANGSRTARSASRAAPAEAATDELEDLPF